MIVFLFCIICRETPEVGADSCLAKAQAMFKRGQFEETIKTLTICLKTKGVNQVQAHALLAKTYVVLDRYEEAREEFQLLLSYDRTYRAEPLDPVGFAQLLKQEKALRSASQVSSVSKAGEKLEEAPATVILITDKMIAERGYKDLVAILQDVPGFDITISNGFYYATINPRGLVNDTSNHILLRFNGIDQNDIRYAVVELSRQYPITCIKRIEIVYGPVSTIYGPNAYSAVIDVITKTASELVKEGNTWGMEIQAGTGDLSTNYLDLALAGRTPSRDFDWNVFLRIFRSEEQDLSSDPSGFRDPTRDWFLSGHAHLRNLTFGFQMWKKNEGGLPQHDDSVKEAFYAPKQTSFSIDYNHSFSDNINLKSSSRFTEKHVGSDTRIITNDFKDTYFYEFSQFKNEIIAQINATEKLSLNFGVDLRLNSIIDKIRTTYPESDKELNFIDFEFTENGIGLFTQANYHFNKHIKLVLGGRLDQWQKSELQETSEDNLATPRLSLIYTAKNSYYKILYSTAYTRSPFNLFNVAIITALDKVEALDFVIGTGSDIYNVEASVFTSRYETKDPKIEFVRGSFKLDPTSDQNFGAQVSADLRKYESVKLHFNYSFVDGGASITSLVGRIGRHKEIARHKANLIVVVKPKATPNLSVNATLNYVGSRKFRGFNVDTSDTIGDYLVTKTAIGFRPHKNMNIGLLVENLFNETYHHPGLFFFDSRQIYPQPGRTLTLQVKKTF